MLDAEKVAEFARRLEAASSDRERQAIQEAFLEYAADFINQFSYHYHDFTPLADGNVGCNMDGYIRPRDRVYYVVDVSTGFIHPLDKDTQRGVQHQAIE